MIGELVQLSVSVSISISWSHQFCIEVTTIRIFITKLRCFSLSVVSANVMYPNDTHINTPDQISIATGQHYTLHTLHTHTRECISSTLSKMKTKKNTQSVERPFWSCPVEIRVMNNFQPTFSFIWEMMIYTTTTTSKKMLPISTPNNMMPCPIKILWNQSE